MAKRAVVFAGRNGLDFIEFREGVLRIPEVTARLRQAQSILDGLEIPHVDLFATLNSDDEEFFRNIQMKSLVAAVVQIGLYDRFLRTQKSPDFMIGNSNGDSALLVCAGLVTFEQMILESKAVTSMKPTVSDVVVQLVASPMPLLSGVSLTEYCALQATTTEQGQTEFTPVKEVSESATMEVRRIVTTLHENFGVVNFVNVGPAAAVRANEYRMMGAGDAESVDSIELDPMLTWFWRTMNTRAIALAQ